MKRIYLTPEIVDGACASELGEIWLADTVVPGFGVRVWNVNGVQGRAYITRVADREGRFFRRTLKKWDLWKLQRSSVRFLFREPSTISFGDLLEEAREWALDEIDRIKGRPTLEEEERAQRERSSKQAQNITLARAAKAVITNLELAGRSQAYRDRLDKLFAAYVPDRVQNKRLVSLTEADLADVLRNPSLSIGNMRTLRPFLGKCIEIGRKFHGQMHSSLWDFERNLNIETQKVVHPMASWKVRQFRELVQYLAGHEMWQQGLCLALYLETREAMRTVMSARWNDFVDASYSSISDPERERFWRREWRANDRRGWGAQITIGANNVFELVARQHANLEADEIFLFPSRHGRQFSHIRSVDHVWRHVLAHYRIPYVSPRMAHVLYNAARRRDHDWSHARLYAPAHGTNVA